MTKQRRRDKESVAKSHRNRIAGIKLPEPKIAEIKITEIKIAEIRIMGTRSSEACILNIKNKRSDASTGSSRGELSMAVPCKAKLLPVLDSSSAFVVIWSVVSSAFKN